MTLEDVKSELAKLETLGHEDSESDERWRSAIRALRRQIEEGETSE